MSKKNIQNDGAHAPNYIIYKLQCIFYFLSNYAQMCTKMLITKTYLYNFDPLKPHFYIVKLGFTLFFIFLLKNLDCGYSLEPPPRGGSNEYLQSMFWAEIWKISEVFIWKFAVFGGEIFYIFA